MVRDDDDEEVPLPDLPANFVVRKDSLFIAKKKRDSITDNNTVTVSPKLLQNDSNNSYDSNIQSSTKSSASSNSFFCCFNSTVSPDSEYIPSDQINTSSTKCSDAPSNVIVNKPIEPKLSITVTTPDNKVLEKVFTPPSPNKQQQRLL